MIKQPKPKEVRHRVVLLWGLCSSLLSRSVSISTLERVITPFICTLQIGIGVIVEMLSFLPSILLVQFFRRIQPRRAQRQLSPLRQAICQVKEQTMLPETKKRSKGTFPWWCLFIAYGVSMLMAVASIFFIIVRGIEFGDTKCQKWLTSLLSSFFSSVILIQPLKVSRPSHMDCDGYK